MRLFVRSLKIPPRSSHYYHITVQLYLRIILLPLEVRDVAVAACGSAEPSGPIAHGRCLMEVTSGAVLSGSDKWTLDDIGHAAVATEIKTRVEGSESARPGLDTAH